VSEIFKVLSGSESQRLYLMCLQKEVPHHKIYGGLGHTMAEEVSLWSLCRPGLNLRQVLVGFMVDKVALGQVFH
jgi:hypothetical protein